MESQPCPPIVRRHRQADTCTCRLCGLRDSIRSGWGFHLLLVSRYWCVVALPFRAVTSPGGSPMPRHATLGVRHILKKEKAPETFSGFRGLFKCRTLILNHSVPGKPSVGVMPTLSVVANAMDMTQREWTRTQLSAIRFAILSLRHDIELGLLGHICNTRILPAGCGSCHSVQCGARKFNASERFCRSVAIRVREMLPKFSICEPFGNIVKRCPRVV